MLFSKLVSFMTLSAIAFAIPAPKAEPELEERQLGSALTVVLALEATVAGLIPGLAVLPLVTLTTTTAVLSIVDEVVLALDTATTALDLLTVVGGLGLEKRADQAQFAQTLASVTTNIANGFGPLKGNKHFPIFVGLLGEVDFALNAVLVQANFLVSGVLITVASLVGTVAGTLDGLLFTLTVGLLGIL